MSLGLITGDILLLRRASMTLLAGTIAGLALSFAFASFLHSIELTPEILARTRPTLLDLAIAVALLPPLSVVDIGLCLH